MEEALKLAGKVRDEVARVLAFYRMQFVSLNELRLVVESSIRREFRLKCRYYVDEEPVVESRQVRGPEGARLVVERAWDTVRCEMGGKEFDFAYVKMRRGVVEFGVGEQFWLVLDVEPYVNEELGGGR